jgi:1-acyl-sn-glycerol-3-phosphate acyltransferase
VPAVASDREVGQLYTFARTVLNPMRKFFFRIDVVGLNHVPTQGPAILCPNHVSFLDSAFLMLVLPRRITYVGKAEYMDDWKTKYLFPAVGMIPIDRGGGSASERALSAATRILDRGELFGIFPEGTRSRDGVLHKGHTGPARLAMRTGAPIIPVGIRGTREIQPPDAVFPKLFMPPAGRGGEVSRASRRSPRAAADHRRGDVQHPRTVGPGLRRHVRHAEGGGSADRDCDGPEGGLNALRVVGGPIAPHLPNKQG